MLYEVITATKKTSSSANIVTNLQFQDIIRQKIEHVQEAQGKLLQKLNDPKPAEVSTDPNSYSLHIIFQTRNIALFVITSYSIHYTKLYDIVICTKSSTV